MNRDTRARFSVTANVMARISPRTSCPDQIWDKPGQTLSAAIQSRLGTVRLLPKRAGEASCYPEIVIGACWGIKHTGRAFNADFAAAPNPRASYPIFAIIQVSGGFAL